MLGVSFSELLIALLVAFFAMKPRDIRKLASWYKDIMKQVIELKAIAQESVNEISEHIETTTKIKRKNKLEYVIDSDNKTQQTFHIDSLKRKKRKT